MNVLSAIAAAIVGAVLAWGTKTWRERRAVKEHDELILRRAGDASRENHDEADRYKITRMEDYANRRDSDDAVNILGLRHPESSRPVRDEAVDDPGPESD